MHAEEIVKGMGLDVLGKKRPGGDLGGGEEINAAGASRCNALAAGANYLGVVAYGLFSTKGACRHVNRPLVWDWAPLRRLVRCLLHVPELAVGYGSRVAGEGAVGVVSVDAEVDDSGSLVRRMSCSQNLE